MRCSRSIASTMALLVLLGSTGCGNATEPAEKEAMSEKLTWQEAKASTQATELEIAALIPKGVVVKVDQMKDGTLFSCDTEQHNWHGATTVTVVEDTEIEPIVKALEEHYQDSRFNTGNRLNVLGDYEAEISSPETAEIYLVAEDDPNTIRIASGSACFTLPEGTYPGGEW